MKRILVGIAALATLIAPQAALSKQAQTAGGARKAATSQPRPAPPVQATPNFHATGTGTAAACGTGCTQVSGTYAGDQLSGSFTAQITQGASTGGCAATWATLTLMHGTDSAIFGLAGTSCGAAFQGDYDVTDGTGAYQENGAGWGQATFTVSRAGAMTVSLSGTFYPNEPRQTGIGYGH